MKNLKSYPSAVIGKGKVFGRTICTRSTSPSKLPFGMTAFLPVVLALSVGCGAAQAQNPNGGGVVPASPPTDYSSFCGLPDKTLSAQVTGSQKTLTLPGGLLIFVSPNLRISLTNNSNGTTVSYVVTGTSKVTDLGNGLLYVTSNGKNLLSVPEANGHPAGLFLTTGTVNFVIDISGTEVREVRTFTGSGTVVDVCKVLAA